jgi:ribosome-associated protein
MASIIVTPTIELDERLITERFVRASGPGGQNVNKVASAVELRFDLRSSSLPPEIKDRVAALAGSRVTVDGVIVIDSREHRTQAQNRDAARARLVELVRRAARPRKSRRPTRPTGAARERRLASKKRRSAVKASRGRRGPSDDV